MGGVVGGPVEVFRCRDFHRPGSRRRGCRHGKPCTKAQVRPSESVLVEPVGDGRMVVAQPWSSLLVRVDRNIAIDLGGERVLYARKGDWVDITDPSDMGLVEAATYEAEYRRTDTRVGKREFGS